MAAAEGEKKGAMEAEKGEKEAMAAEKGAEKEAMAAEKGAPVEEKGKGEEGAVTSEENNGEAATKKGKGVAEAEEVVGVKMITVKSMDGEERFMSVAAAELSALLRGMIEDGCHYSVIELQNVDTGRALDTVIEYCTKHAAEPVKSDPVAAASTSSNSNPSTEAASNCGGVITAASENLEDWDRDLVDRLSMDDLYDVISAANYLHIKGLLDVVYQKVADMIKGKTTNQIRATFNIANDFTPEEEAELRQQYAWNFDNDK